MLNQAEVGLGAKGAEGVGRICRNQRVVLSQDALLRDQATGPYSAQIGVLEQIQSLLEGRTIWNRGGLKLIAYLLCLTVPMGDQVREMPHAGFSIQPDAPAEVLEGRGFDGVGPVVACDHAGLRGEKGQ